MQPVSRPIKRDKTRLPAYRLLIAIIGQNRWPFFGSFFFKHTIVQIEEELISRVLLSSRARARKAAIEKAPRRESASKQQRAVKKKRELSKSPHYLSIHYRQIKYLHSFTDYLLWLRSLWKFTFCVPLLALINCHCRPSPELDVNVKGKLLILFFFSFSLEIINDGSKRRRGINFRNFISPGLQSTKLTICQPSAEPKFNPNNNK